MPIPPLRRSSPALPFAPLLLVAACAGGAETLPAGLRDDTPIDAASVRLVVRGLGCPQCASNVDLMLMRVPGVRSATVDLGTGFVDVELQQPAPSRRALAQAVHDSGFTILDIEPR